jgi:CBS-domain-containing membrane protein
MLSDRDLRQVVGDPLGVFDDAARRSRLQATKVSDAMTQDPRCLLVEDPLASAVELFASERFGAVPVVDADERLAGLLSYVDVLRCVAERLDDS